MMDNPKCPYCGGEMDVGGDDIFGYNCICTFCGSSSPQRATLEAAYAAAMRREKKCKTYAEDFKEHFGHSWNNKDNNWQCRGKLYNDNADCVNFPRCDCEACWNEEMEEQDE